MDIACPIHRKLLINISVNLSGLQLTNDRKSGRSGTATRLFKSMNTTTIKNLVLSPTTRIAFGLVMFTLSLLLVSDFIGLLPSHEKSQLQSRKFVAESIALQTNIAVSKDDLDSLGPLYTAFLNRNDDLSSIALMNADGELLVNGGDQDELASNDRVGLDSKTTVNVDIRNPDGVRSELRLVFTESVDNSFGKSLFPLLIYFSLAGFLGFAIFLRRVLKELDPDKAIPDRVRNALDTLSEGLMIVDQNGLILFLNESLANRIGIEPSRLIGSRASDLRWSIASEDSDDLQPALTASDLPWEKVLAGDEIDTLKNLRLQISPSKSYTFSVNTSSILDGDDSVRGVLVTLSDITEVEKQRDELQSTLVVLEKTQGEITRKNEALYKLATRDPLTDVLNRRAFFEAFDSLFEESVRSNSSLICLMTDIDKFKSVNDTYGHSVGDEVIQYLANVLTEFGENKFVVGRFGGEEFAMLMPDTSLTSGANLAERIRSHIETSSGNEISEKISITACFGVAGIPGEADSPRDLLELADAALYFAKENGRNRVAMHAEGEISPFDEEVATSADNCVMNESDSGIAPDSFFDHPDNQDSSIELLDTDTPLQSLIHSDSDEDDTTHGERRRQNLATADVSGHKGAKILEPATAQVTQRNVLVFNIEQSLQRAAKTNELCALLILNSSTLVQIHNSMGFIAGVAAGTSLVEILSLTLRNYDLISQTSPHHTLEYNKEQIEQQDNESGLNTTVLRTEDFDIAILVSAIADEADIGVIVGRIRYALNKPVSVDGYEYIMEASIGVASSNGEILDGTLLLKNAGIACAAAQKTGRRNSTVVYSEEIDRESKRLLTLRNDLNSAAIRNELKLYYQPKYDTTTGELTGLEALLRWHHPKLGNISAAEFIPLAEQLDLIASISQWTIREAMDQLQTWALQGHDSISVAVNLSASELRDVTLIGFLIAELESRQLKPENFELEITETAGIESSSVASKILHDLSDYGFVIAIDDFGTGFASLSYLNAFPIDRIKIDRIFVTGIDSDIRKQRLFRSILSLGASMQISVLAEGVETREELAVLQEQGCAQVQGYYTGRPADADSIREKLRQGDTRSQEILRSLLSLESASIIDGNNFGSGFGGRTGENPDVGRGARSGSRGQNDGVGFGDARAVINQFTSRDIAIVENQASDEMHELPGKTGTDA